MTFRRIASKVGELVEAKNAAYGSSFAKAGEFMRLLFPDGIPAAQLIDSLLIARIFDKLMRVATAKDAFGESPYRDIAGYGILGASLHDKEGKCEFASGPAADARPESSRAASAPSAVSAKTTTNANGKAAPPRNAATTAIRSSRTSAAARARRSK